MNRIDAVFQKLLSGQKILIMDGRTNGRTNGRTGERTHARTGVKLNAPPPFFEWRGHKKSLLLFFTIIMSNQVGVSKFLKELQVIQSSTLGTYHLALLLTDSNAWCVPVLIRWTRGPKGPWVAHLRKRSKVTVEPFTESPKMLSTNYWKRTSSWCYTSNMKALGHVVSDKEIFNNCILKTYF